MEPLSESEVFVSLDWRENPAAKRLLDVVVASLAEEFVQVVKENPEIFSE
ncbi:MAG: hypothetical protein WB791_01345 [Waddliaceae bacterium]